MENECKQNFGARAEPESTLLEVWEMWQQRRGLRCIGMLGIDAF